MGARRFLVALLIVFLADGLVLGRERFKQKGNQYEVKGKDVPLYMGAFHFFNTLFDVRKKGEDWYRSYLERIAVKPDGMEAEVLTKYMLEAHEILSRTLAPPPDIDDGTWEFLQNQFTESQVLDLKNLCKRLKDEFSAAGGSFSTLQKQFEKTRDGVAIASTGPDEELLEIMDLFEKEDTP